MEKKVDQKQENGCDFNGFSVVVILLKQLSLNLCVLVYVKYTLQYICAPQMFYPVSPITIIKFHHLIWLFFLLWIKKFLIDLFSILLMESVMLNCSHISIKKMELGIHHNSKNDNAYAHISELFLFFFSLTHH